MTLDEFKKLDHVYLGDGAYVCWTGFSFVIITTDGISIQNEVHLQGSEVRALNNFITAYMSIS